VPTIHAEQPVPRCGPRIADVRRDKSDRSDRRGAARVLTLQVALAEINYQGTEPAKNAELYKRGGLSEVKARKCLVCAIPLRSVKGPEPLLGPVSGCYPSGISMAISRISSEMPSGSP
jgi:hypothetical protein